MIIELARVKTHKYLCKQFTKHAKTNSCAKAVASWWLVCKWKRFVYLTTYVRGQSAEIMLRYHQSLSEKKHSGILYCANHL